MCAHTAEGIALVAAIGGDGPLSATLDDGANAIALAETAGLSMKSGKPVQLYDY